MPACIKNIFALIFCLMVLPLVGICQCPVPAASNTISQPVPDPPTCGITDPSVINGMASGTYSYQWQRSADNLNFTDIVGATGATYDPTTILATTYYRRKVTTSTCITPSYSNAITVSVISLQSNIINAPLVSSFCGSVDAPVLITGNAPAGVVTYQWEQSNDNVNFVPIGGITTKDYTPPSFVGGQTFFRRIITTSVCSTPIVSNSVTITYDAAFSNSVITVSSSTHTCAYFDYNIIGNVPSGGITTQYSYQWFSSADNISFTLIAGATGVDYDPPPAYETTYYRRTTFSSACTTPLNSNSVGEALINSSVNGNVISVTDPPAVTCAASVDPPLINGTDVTMGVGNYVYQWQSSVDGITFTDIAGAVSKDHDPPTISTTTTYRRIITSAVCNIPSVSNLVKITINDPPVGTISGPVSICYGSSTVLTASGGVTYQWSPATGLSATNVASPTAAPLTTTTYIVTLANGSCSVPLSVTVTVVPKPKVDAGSDKNILKGDKVQLTGQVTDSVDVKYSWSPSTYLNDPTILKPIATPTQDITYTLTATTPNGCFVVSDDVTVKVYVKVVIPNAFTPNADGVNDTWDIVALSSYGNSVLNVYNRNGMLIYKSTGYSKPWDGTYKGKQVPMGAYYYVIDLKNGEKAMSGWVAVIK
jgi:gliding motility-associated-like protein